MSERTDALYQGGFLIAALAVSAVIVSVVQPDRGVLGRFLSVSPLRWVGRISYGLYLWHWPVYLTLTETRTGLDGFWLLVGAGRGERRRWPRCRSTRWSGPIRAGTFRLPKPQIVAIAAVSRARRRGVRHHHRRRRLGRRQHRARAACERAGARSPRRRHRPLPTPAPTTGAAATAPAAPPKVMVVGDSVAGHARARLREPERVHRADGVEPRSASGAACSTTGRSTRAASSRRSSAACNWREEWPGELQLFKPDVVMLLVGAWDILDREVDGHLVKFGSVEYDTSFLHQLDDATTLLASTGAKVVVLTTPFFSRPELVGQTGREWPEYDPWRVDRINSLYRDFLANHPGRYRMIDLNKFVSPQGKFTDELNGQVIRGDGVHFTEAGSTMVVDWLTPQLKEVAAGEDPDPAADGRAPRLAGLWAK